MTKARKMLSMALAVLFTAFACLGTVPAHAKILKPVLPKIQIMTQPKAEYTVGERVSFQVKAPNYGGKVQYRAILWDGNNKVQRELWPTMPGYFYTKWMPTGPTTFTIGWNITEPGIYNVTVLVKRAGSSSKYDSLIKTANFVVKAKDKNVTLNTPGQTYGSADSTKIETIEGDVYIKADNITLRNVKVLGTVVVDPGKDGTANLVNIVAKKISVLSGGKNSIHIKDSKADGLDASSTNPVRIEADGDTEIVGTTANGYIIFDKKNGTYGTITITKNENGENVIEFRGDIKDEVIVEAKSTISTPEGSKVENLKISPEDPNAKITLQGEFTNVGVEKKAEVAVAANTKITNTMEVKAEAKITSDSTAVVNNVKIAPENKDATITLQGTFKDVEVAKESNVEFSAGTKIENVELKAPAQVVVEKGAEIVTIDKNNNNVNIDNQGTIGQQENTGGTPSGNDNPPPYIPPTEVTNENAALNTALNAVINDFNSYSLAQTVFLPVNTLNASGKQNTIDITIKDAYKNLTVEQIVMLVRSKALAHGKVPSAKDINTFNHLKTLFDNTNINSSSLKSYIVNRLAPSSKLRAFIDDMKITTYGDLYDELNSTDFDSYDEIMAVVNSLIPGSGLTINSITYGSNLTLDSLKIGTTTIYGGADKTITLEEIRSALGSAGVSIKSKHVLDFNGISTVMTFKGTSGTIYTYTINLHVQNI